MTARLLTRTRHCITGRISAASIRTAAAFCSSRAQSSLSPHGSACFLGRRAPRPTAATHPAVTPRSPTADAPRPLRRPHTAARARAGRSPAPAEPALFPPSAPIPVLGTAATGGGERRAGGRCPARGCLAGPPWRRSSGRQRRETEGEKERRPRRSGRAAPARPGGATVPPGAASSPPWGRTRSSPPTAAACGPPLPGGRRGRASRHGRAAPHAAI